MLLESHSNDNADGAGVTLRTLDNPTTGAIFAVRSSGNAARLWVGQDITTPGDNPFYAGFTGTAGGEAVTTNYIHSLTSTLAQLGTPVQCDSTLTVAGALTAASLAGGAATQVTTEITAAVATKQDVLTAHGGSGNNLLNSAVPAGKLANIFGASPIEVAAIFAPGTADHGNLQISLSTAKFSA